MPRLSKIGAAALAAFGWTLGATSVSASYLVVAGGGGGYIGGGGAGGFLTGTTTLNTTLSYTVTVGAGGATNANGGNSVFNAVTATGGGGGAAGGAANSGGSGGGGSYSSGAGAAGTSGQGNAGGSGSVRSGGGGGGASAAGSTAPGADTGGNGGNGTASSISGSSVTYAGGGGGSCGSGTSSGGSGGGGTGSYSGSSSAPGGVNTGGGSGGAQVVDSPAGGSGIVIISYTSATQLFGGGTVTFSGGNCIHTFTTSGTLSPLSTPLSVSYLVVAGGGGGGGLRAGGGGAGGYRTGTASLDTNSIYTVTVGAGGTGGNGGAAASGVQGSSSAFFSTTSAGGGGGAGANVGGGSSGGSGGGGADGSGAGGSGNTPSTSPSQGNNGGTGYESGSNRGGGGGGGASAVGATATGGGAGNGGVGTTSSISGTSVTRAGGGGGGSWNLPTGSGGSGGGGDGGGNSGTANLGGGGGGGNNSGSTTGGSGGSGVVIISYAGTQQFGGGVVTFSGSNTIHTFTSSGYLAPIKTVNRSLRFRNSASAYLNRTPVTTGNRQTFTVSMWVKLGSTGAGTVRGALFGGGNCATGGGTGLGVHIQGTSEGSRIQAFVGGGTTMLLVSSNKYRDPSAWYHMVFSVDTTQSTAANRFRMYVNNQEITSFDSNTQIAQNTSLNWNLSGTGTYIGAYNDGTPISTYFDGYLTEINAIDGQQLTPSSFGAYNSYGVWQPTVYAGSYGTNGFYLTFGNNTSTTTLGYDTSSASNNWTTNNISVTAGATYDSMLDVPTLTSATVANYAVMNPLSNIGTGNLYTFSNGNLSTTVNVTTGGRGIVSTYGMTSGAGIKYYVEINVTAFGASNNSDYGILNTTTTVMTTGSFAEAGCIGAYLSNGYAISETGKVLNNGSTLASGLATFVDGDIVQIAYDGTNIYFGRNGTWLNSAVPASGTGGFSVAAGTYAIAMGASANTTKTATANFNFGQQPFTYTPPSGFVALNTYNLSTPTIPNGATQFAATTYTGNGTSQSISNSVNGTSFQPDFVWYKDRSVARDHGLFDVARGALDLLSSNTSGAASSVAGTLTSFNSNGYSIGSAANANGSGETYVGWQWKANGTGVSNTSGSITSTVSANTTAGFSVVTYTGTGASGTVGHGLGVTPNMIIYKQRSQTSNWTVMHSSLPNMTSNDLFLNTTGALDTLTNAVPAPTSSTFGVSLSVAGSGQTCVAYVFAAVAGYSAFGSYTGNGSTDGPFVFLGFRPRFWLVKRTDSSNNWMLEDTSRDPSNVASLRLCPDANYTEAGTSANYLDFVSNGMKIRTSDTPWNASGGTYIYMAFAENPFKYSNAR